MQFTQPGEAGLYVAARLGLTLGHGGDAVFQRTGTAAMALQCGQQRLQAAYRLFAGQFMLVEADGVEPVLDAGREEAGQRQEGHDGDEQEFLREAQAGNRPADQGQHQGVSFRLPARTVAGVTCQG